MNVLLSQLARPVGPSQGVSLPIEMAESPSFIRHFIRIAQRRKWPIVAAVVASLILGLVITFLMTPKYTAISVIEISRESDQVTSFNGVERETSIMDQEFYQTQYGLLKTRALAERVATRLRLVDDPNFFEAFGGVPEDNPAFVPVNGRYPAAGRAERQRKAGEILLANVAIDPTRLSRLVAIGFTSPDPVLSSKIANAWAENFIESNLERKVQATSYGRDQLQRQLAEYKDRLDNSQRQLVAYASREQIINLPTQGAPNSVTTQERPIVADELASLNAELSSAVADRIRAQARASNASSTPSEALSNQAINGLRERRAELAGEYQQLMVRFQPDYPAAKALQSQIRQLDQSIAREESRVAGSLQADFRAAQQREDALQARVNQLKGDYLDLRRRSIQYNIYQQEVDTNRALYDGLLQRFKEIGVAGGVGVNNVAIVEVADVPKLPSSPKLAINLLVSLIAGLTIGAALAFALEQMDETITDPDEVTRRLGLPVLGSIPRTDDPVADLKDRKSDLFDAYLSVQTNLGFATDHGVPRAFAVTSTKPSEGKSTTSWTLASTIARAGKRVILIDGDMRSPSVHHLGGVGHERGLSNFLAGDDAIESMTFEPANFGFTAMSAGPLPPNAAELLTGLRLSLLIERLLEKYDHVVIDSPPVMGLADAPLIASRVEGVVYVIESHGTRSRLVKTALQRLASANAHLFGAILTKFDARQSQYGYEYGYSYGRNPEAEPAH